MKRIICIGILWCCTLLARAQTTTTLKYQQKSPGPFCCPFDSWCNDDIDCNAGRFACRFSPASLDMAFIFLTPDPGGTIGFNPFRYTVDLLHNGITIAVDHSPNLPTTNGNALRSVFFNVTPLLLGAYQAKVAFQKRTIGGWVTVGTYFTNTIKVISFCPPYIITLCGSNVTISGTNFTTPLTESQTWIASSGATVVPGNANVKLDADPANGFVLLNPGFETQPGANLVAQAFNGCASGAPMRQAPGNQTVGDALVQEKETGAASSKKASAIYPNPTKGAITVRHNRDVKTLQVYAATGVLLKTINTNKSTVTTIDLGTQPAGMYILRADGILLGRIIKQ